VWEKQTDIDRYRVSIIQREVSDCCCVKKVKQSRYRPGVAQRDPGGLDLQISMTFGT